MKTSTNERFISQTSIIDIDSVNARTNDLLTFLPVSSFDVGCSEFDVRCSPIGFRVPSSSLRVLFRLSPKCQPIPTDSTGGMAPRSRYSRARTLPSCSRKPLSFECGRALSCQIVYGGGRPSVGLWTQDFGLRTSPVDSQPHLTFTPSARSFRQ